MNANENIRRRILFSGNVQGVGFRYTTQRISQGHAVTGFVRNLSDGRVELVAEGSEPVVQAFLAQVSQTMTKYIREVRAVEEPATGEWKSFNVAR